MAFINWTDQMSVGSDFIDEQHKELLNILNRLMDSMVHRKADDEKEEIKSILKALTHYTRFHFASEEKLMESIGFPDLSEHKQIHENFVHRVMEFEENFRNGKFGLDIEMMGFLKDWLVHHIMETDKKYTGYLKS